MVSTGNRASPFHSWPVLLKIGSVLFKTVVPVFEGFKQAVRSLSFEAHHFSVQQGLTTSTTDG